MGEKAKDNPLEDILSKEKIESPKSHILRNTLIIAGIGASALASYIVYQYAHILDGASYHLGPL